MRTKLATYALAGTLGLVGVVGGALVAPAVSYAATGDSTALDARLTSLKEALTGLVSDGSITQAQADEVATTLAEARVGDGHGPHGGRVDLAAAAEALGITEDALRTAAEEGTTLAELAEQEGVSTDTLVDALVEARQTSLAEAVTEGRLTQAEADEKAADREARVTESLDDPIGRGHGGGMRDGHAGGDADADASTTPAPAEDDAA